MQVRNDAELSKLLGISPAAVSRLKGRGMPTHDLEAAQIWRAQNLNPAMVKDPRGARAASGHRAGAVSVKALVTRVETLMSLADAAIGTDTFDALREPLREAMRAVPQAERAQVLLSIKVLDVLCGPVLEAVHGEPAGEPVTVEMTNEEAEWGGSYLYSMACGECFELDPVPA